MVSKLLNELIKGQSSGAGHPTFTDSLFLAQPLSNPGVLIIIIIINHCHFFLFSEPFLEELIKHAKYAN